MGGPDPLARIILEGMAAVAAKRGMPRYSQRQFAKELGGSSEGKVRYLLAGGRRGKRGEPRVQIPKIALLHRVAEVLDIPFQQLMDAAVASTDAARFQTARSENGGTVLLAWDDLVDDPEAAATRSKRISDVASDPEAG